MNEESVAKGKQIVAMMEEAFANNTLEDVFFYVHGVIRTVHILADTTVKAEIINSEVFQKVVDKAGFLLL